ncbi:MAG: hypothetical protein ACI97A_004344, partial [Planctomycetota bacterium]
ERIFARKARGTEKVALTSGRNDSAHKVLILRLWTSDRTVEGGSLKALRQNALFGENLASNSLFCRFVVPILGEWLEVGPIEIGA